VIAGAVVSGSFQANDQTYMIDTLGKLGAGWVGVTQIANDYPASEIAKLGKVGVRAVRFNIQRGRIDDIALATRCHAVGGWHAEFYVDAASLAPHFDRLSKLPQIVIDHLGMTEEGVPVLLDLVAAGCKVKATGFGRVKNGRAENARTHRAEKPLRACFRDRHAFHARTAAVHAV
jgi:predicted TIM-barrel fold metal-dependent hydrolase